MVEFSCPAFDAGVKMKNIKTENNKNGRFSMPKVFGVFLMASVIATQAFAATPMSDSEMAGVNGKGLFVADTIVGSGAGTGMTYTRIGLDTQIDMNININKFQLGCGGFNETIRTGCDIDMDFVRLMGRSGNAEGAAGSDFTLLRPYLEVATKGSGVTREVVGFKIGAQSADGFFGVGRRYANGQTNLENGGTCGTAAGAAALACHSGLNMLSGNVHVEMSASLPVTICTLGIVFGSCLGPTTSTACFGRTTIDANCGAGNTPVYRDIIGTRINALDAQSIQLKLNGGLGGLIGSAYSWITEDLRFIHGFALQNTSDFFLSFQREKVSYPTYTTNSSTAAASQTYSPAANAGWWMNVPDLKALDIQGAEVKIDLIDALSTFGPPGLHLTNIELNSTPPVNCFGASSFC